MKAKLHIYNYNFLIRKILTTLVGQNNIHTGAVVYSINYYEDLGLSKNATQGEIKAAYYKLSMLYHPDKNQGSESAAIKFRQITQAYEVLGNFRLRRLYDKGVMQTAGSQYAHKTGAAKCEDFVVEDDPSTKFYKSRFTKSQVSDSKGRTPIYDFDEWSKAHYGKSFDRRQAAKEKVERKKNQAKEGAFITQKEVLFFSFGVACVLIYFNIMAELSYDNPKEKSIKNQNEKDT